jgi:Kef-type K+ transport system membrane component KefB
MEEVLVSLGIIIGISALMTILARLIKQPPLIAYLIAGVISGPLILNLISPSSSEIIQLFAHIGVAFLLFIVGLSLDFRVLKEVGGVASLAGFTEIALTAIVGFSIAIALGFGTTTSLFVATALAFSSTVVVVKILSDKREINTLHGRIAIGILIVEDFVAAIALMIVPLINNGGSIMDIFSKMIIGISLIGLIFAFSHFILKRFLNYLARNQEVLFLFGIAWAFAIALIFDYLGFSLEIGALIAGMSLASTKYALDLGGKIKPLRDFFVVLFFVFFGSQLNQSITLSTIGIAILFSAFIVIGKPIIVMTALKIFGYKKRTNFLAGSALAQISEFSLVLTLMGFKLGQISQEIMSIMVLISIITIGVSSYNIYYAHHWYKKLEKVLWIFEGRKEENEKDNKVEHDIVLLGYHRIGYKLLQKIKNMKLSVVVIDYNPKVILNLSEKKIDCIYGDAGDKEFLREIGLDKAKIVISTIPDENANISIAEVLKELKSDTAFIATAEQPRQALDLYENDIDYVIVPHHLGGDFVAELIEQFGKNKSKYKELGKEHKKTLSRGKESSSF